MRIRISFLFIPRTGNPFCLEVLLDRRRQRAPGSLLPRRIQGFLEQMKKVRIEVPHFMTLANDFHRRR